MLRSRRRGDLQRYEIGVVMPIAWISGGGHGELAAHSSRESSHDRDHGGSRGNLIPRRTHDAKSVATREQSAREARGLLNA
jgi:hypothetical protein